MTILEEIINYKITEVAAAKNKMSIERLREMPYFSRKCYELRDFLLNRNKHSIIAEYKRASPSKGVINSEAEIATVVKGYEDAGVAAISVLTDNKFFKGSLNDLHIARETVRVPLLRKDFVIDEYQIAEAKAYGADIVLLIAAALSVQQVDSLARYAKMLGLNVLLEVHNLQELQDNCWDAVDAIGVNNRNLKTFDVSIDHSVQLEKHIPDKYLKISESGIHNPETIEQLKAIGFQGFLIGENFMRDPHPEQSILRFVNQLK